MSEEFDKILADYKQRFHHGQFKLLPKESIRAAVRQAKVPNEYGVYLITASSTGVSPVKETINELIYTITASSTGVPPVKETINELIYTITVSSTGVSPVKDSTNQTWHGRPAYENANGEASSTGVPPVKETIDEVIYIGKAGTMKNAGTFLPQSLQKRLTAKQHGMSRDKFFQQQIEKHNLDYLQFDYFVTVNTEQCIIPAHAEAELLQTFYDDYGRLPRLNRSD